MISLHSSSQQQGYVATSGKSSSHASSVAGVAQGVALAIGLTVAANSYATSGPTASEVPSYDAGAISVVKPNQQADVSPYKIATPKKGDSVQAFMIRNFKPVNLKTLEWQDRLVNVRTGEILTDATKLRAGDKYAYSLDPREAIKLSIMIKDRNLKKEEAVVTKDVSPKIKPHNYFAVPEEELLSVAKRVGLTEEHFPKVMALVASVGVKESSLSYVAQGSVITNEKSDHFGTKAQGKYGVMPINISVWSVDYFGTKLDFKKPENQDKIAFARIADLYAEYMEKGLSELEIVRKIGTRWYGTGPVMKGQPTPSKYQSDFVRLYKQVSKNFDPVFGMAHAFKNGKLDPAVVAQAPSQESIVSHQVSTLPRVESLKNNVKRASFSTVSANTVSSTVHYEVPQSKKPMILASLDGVQGIGMIEKSAPFAQEEPVVQKVEITPIIEGEATRTVRTQLHITRILAALNNDPNISESVRESARAKIERAPDLRVYYVKTIEHYEAQAQRGSLYAKHILPGLRVLLKDIEGSPTVLATNNVYESGLTKMGKDMCSQRDTCLRNIAYYEAQAKNGDELAKKILPGLHKLLQKIESNGAITAANDSQISSQKKAA